MKINNLKPTLEPDELINVDLTIGELFLINRVLGVNSHGEHASACNINPTRSITVSDGARENVAYIVEFNNIYKESSKLLESRGWLVKHDE